MKKTVVVILGMHRSGTSALAGALSGMGMYMGAHLSGADEWNKKGYFEDRRIVEINDELLRMHNRRWNSIAPIEFFSKSKKIDDLKLVASEVIREISLGGNPSGIKDPRISITLPFWRDVFYLAKVEPKYVLSIREPLAVVNSLKNRDGISIDRAVWIYKNYLYSIFEGLIGTPIYLIKYENLINFSVKELTQLAKEIRLKPDLVSINKVAKLFIEQDLNHFKANREKFKDFKFKNIFTLFSELNGVLDPLSIANTPEWRLFKDDMTNASNSLIFFEKISLSDNEIFLVNDRLNKTQLGLKRAEELANQRLASLEMVELQLQKTQDAQENAESIAAENAAELKRLTLQLMQTETAKTCAEEFANQRLASLEMVELQLQKTQDAQENAESIAAENAAELKRLTLQLMQTEAAKTCAEELANQRLASLEMVELQLQKTQDAQENAESIAAENAAELKRLTLQLMQTETAKTCAEELANQRLASLEMVELQLQKTQDAQENAESIAAENAAELKRLTLQLMQTETAKTCAEEFANQRLASLEMVELQLQKTQDAQENAESIAAENAAELKRLTLQLMQTETAKTCAEELKNEVNLLNVRIANELNQIKNSYAWKIINFVLRNK